MLETLTQYKDVITAVTGMLAIIVSLVSLGFAIRAMSLQRLHNRKTLAPIPYFSMGDYENHLFVRLNNDGAGPMIIDSIQVIDTVQSVEVGAALIELMPVDIVWETFVRNISGRALRPGNEILMLSLKGDPSDPAFAAARDAVRSRLARLLVRVNFHSIYDEKNHSERSLDWFARGK